MEPKHFIRAAIAVSVVGHLALAFGVIFADARPFEDRPPQSIAIDIVKAEDLKPPEKETPTPQAQPQQQPDPFRLPDPSAIEQKPQAAQQKPVSPSPAKTAQQVAQQAQQAAGQQAKPSPAPQPQPQRQAALQQQEPPQPVSQPAPVGAEPDVTVKYGVLLGLPTGDGGSPALAKADIASLDIAEFRRHLKACSSLPGSVTPADKVRIVIRAFLSPDGKLTTTPTLIEASASAKGPLLMQAAIKALEACQPYTMLPHDKYKEWRVLDLAFTPQDFTG